jgi:hypothetical protein
MGNPDQILRIKTSVALGTVGAALGSLLIWLATELLEDVDFLEKESNTANKERAEMRKDIGYLKEKIK